MNTILQLLCLFGVAANVYGQTCQNDCVSGIIIKAYSIYVYSYKMSVVSMWFTYLYGDMGLLKKRRIESLLQDYDVYICPEYKTKRTIELMPIVCEC